MTSFAVTVPTGFEIRHAHGGEGWSATIDGSTATWTGGSIAARSTTTFGVVLKADRSPGAVTLQAEEGYGGGEVVRWPVALTVVPGAASPSQNVALAVVVALLGMLMVMAVVAGLAPTNTSREIAEAAATVGRRDLHAIRR